MEHVGVLVACHVHLLGGQAGHDEESLGGGLNRAIIAGGGVKVHGHGHVQNLKNEPTFIIVTCNPL